MLTYRVGFDKCDEEGWQCGRSGLVVCSFFNYAGGGSSDICHIRQAVGGHEFVSEECTSLKFHVCYIYFLIGERYKC